MGCMVTIFTPTYNRKEKLKELYHSLINQTNKNFEWVIVDDGSSDDTESYIKTILNGPIKISYHYQQNSGKHIAYNEGLERARGVFFICVDSDDQLVQDAVDIIIKCLFEEKNDGIIGCVFPQILNKKYDKKAWTELKGKLIDIIDTKELYGIKETAIALKTPFIKQFRFPTFYDCEGSPEKFCPETVLYNMFIGKGKFRVLDKPIYISNYLNEGLTNNIWRNWVNNSKGVLFAMKQRYMVAGKYQIGKRIKIRAKQIININSICIAKHISIVENTPSIVYSFLLYFPSIIISKKRFG